MGQQISPAAEGMSRFTPLAEAYADNTTVVNEVRSAVNTTPTKPRSISNGSKVGSAPPATRVLLKDTQSSSTSTPVDCLTPEDDDLPATITSPVSKTSQSKGIAKGSTSRRIKAKTEESIRSPNSLSSAPANWETEPATHVTIPEKTRGRPRKNVTPPAATTSTYQATDKGKRKRLSTESVEDQAEGDIEYQVIVSRSKQLKRDAARPSTPTLPNPCVDLDTPASLPDMTPGSSVMSTPPVFKARAAGKKQRKRYTMRDFEQRVSPEKFDEIMAQRGPSITAAAAGITRGSTRSGRLRKM